MADDGTLIAIEADVADRPPELPIGPHPLAYPTFGEEPLRDPALRITHADGVESTRLRFVRLAEEIVGLLSSRARGATICPMIAQGGRAVDPSKAKGPIRIRLS